MKNIVYLTAILFTPLLAQGQIKFGMRGGANIGIASEISAKQNPITIEGTSSPLTGFYLGGTALWKPRNVGYQVNLSLIGDGTILNEDDIFEETTILFIKTQIDLMARFYIGKQFSTGLGLYVGIIDHVQELDNNGNSSNTTESYEEMDFGVLGSFEYSLKNGFFFEAGYNIGLVNLIKNDDPNIEYTYTQTSFKLGLGYRFNNRIE